MTLQKFYKPIEAVPRMGIPCTKHTADRYILNMAEDGLLIESHKIKSNRKNQSWSIAESDIISISEKIRSGQYVPHVKKLKQAA